MKRQDKVAKVISTILIVVFVLATVVLAIMPINDAKLIEESFEITYTGEGFWWELSGEVDNCTICDITEMEYEIVIEDEFGRKLQTANVKVNKRIKAGEIGYFSQRFMITNSNASQWSIEKDPTCVYDTFPWWIMAIAYIVVHLLLQLIFAKRKYYFEVNGHQVVVFASFKQAAIIVDGVLVKKGKLPSFRQEVALFNYRIDDQSISIYTLNGALIPSARITLNRVDVKYTKVRQNPFVKLMDEGVVMGQGNIEMRSRYEIEGEAADKYNEEQRQKREMAEKGIPANKKFCPYCGCENDATNSKCSGCGANLHG